MCCCGTHVLDLVETKPDCRKLQVPESDIRTSYATVEILLSDIRNGSKNLSWFALALKLSAYISSRIDHVERLDHEEDKWAVLATQTEHVGKQIQELRLFLPNDNEIFRIASGTLLYCAAVIKYLERRPTSCQRLATHFLAPCRGDLTTAAVCCRG